MRIRQMDVFLYRTVFQILEWRNGCVYKTKKLGFISVLGLPDNVYCYENKYIFASTSAQYSDPKSKLAMPAPDGFPTVDLTPMLTLADLK